jgi:hypothetical protein
MKQDKYNLSDNVQFMQLWEHCVSSKNEFNNNGCSLHIDLNSRNEYIKYVYSDRNIEKMLYEFDAFIGNPIKVRVSSDIYDKLLFDKNIKLSENSLRNLIDLEEIILLD